MTAFWQARTRREQVMLAGLGLIALAYAAVVLAWQPLTQKRAQQMAQFARYGQAVLALQQVNPAALQLRPVTADMPLPTLVTTTADAAGLAISRLVPSDTTVELTLESAAFATVLPWIAALEQDHALRVLSLTVTRRPEPGVVATTLIVGR